MPETSHLEQEPREQTKTKIILEFLRHGEKEKADKPENEIRLTEKGRAMATTRGQEIKPQPEVAIAFGSPRKRAQETAGRVLLANTGQITDDTTLEEMTSLIGQELKIGKKIVGDERLDFQQNRKSQFGQQHLAAFKAGKVMEFMVNDSDRLANELQDPEAFSYSRIAANMAEIIQRYLRIGNSFEKIVEKNPGQYDAYHNQLERYFGTHQTVGESFIAKLLEVTQGIQARDEYLKEVGGSGVAELQGFQVEIINDIDKQTAKIHTKTPEKQWSIPIDEKILQQIIGQRI
jgi:hypothetical protein